VRACACACTSNCSRTLLSDTRLPAARGSRREKTPRERVKSRRRRTDAEGVHRAYTWRPQGLSVQPRFEFVTR